MLKTVSLSFILSIALVFADACRSSQELTQPARPDKTLGWTETAGNGYVSIGIFVLNKGQTTEKGNLGIQVLDIVKPESRSEGYAALPKAVLRFYRPEDGKTICEATFTKGGSVLGEGPPYPYCTPELGLSGIQINAINTQEGWVWFELRKS